MAEKKKGTSLCRHLIEERKLIWNLARNDISSVEKYCDKVILLK